MRATVVVDNRKNDALPGEWGLCIYIEYGERKLLLDTGASELFAENAEKLGLDLSAVDAAVLSHAHYDHGNGMEAFFRRNDHAPFYVGPTCAADCYAGRWLFRRYIGIPTTVLSDYSRRIRYVREKTEIFPGVTLLPHSTPGLQRAGRREHMFRRVGGRWQPDDFSHEQSLVLETEEGLVIFNSCSHAGADNVINEVAAAFPGKTVRAMIGGFHLYNKSEAEVKTLAQKLEATGVAYICTGHCTGPKAYELLARTLGRRLHPLQVGLTMEF